MRITPLSKDDITTALATVLTGDGTRTVLEAGYISGITIRAGHIGFVLEAPEEERGMLEEACKRALAAFPGVERVSVVTTHHSNETPHAAAGGVSPEHVSLRSAGARSIETTQRPKATYNTTPLPGVSRIIAIASGKGGVGKSSLTLLLAHALAARSEPVAILDADIHGPSIPRMLGIDSTPPAVVDGLMQPPTRHGIMANSMGFISGDTAAIWRGAMVTKALHQLLRGTDWRAPHSKDNAHIETTHAAVGGVSPEPVSLRRSVDRSIETTLLIDLPPGTGDVQLTLMQAVPVTAALIVTTPQEIALADARKAATMFRKIGVPILGVIENMSYFITPDGAQHRLFGEGGGQTLADAFSVPLLAQLPLDPAIGTALDKGEKPPSLLTHSDEALHALISKLLLV